MGTTYTFTVFGILGFIFFKIGAKSLVLYASGAIGLTLLFAIFYRKVLDEGGQSILLLLILLVVYAFGLLSQIYPLSMSAFVFAVIIFVLNAQRYIRFLLVVRIRMSLKLLARLYFSQLLSYYSFQIRMLCHAYLFCHLKFG